MPITPENTVLQGNLKKMMIYAYDDAALTQQSEVAGVDNPYVALINPENYNTEYKVEFNTEQGQGTTAGTAKFTRKGPEEISFEFLSIIRELLMAKAKAILPTT